MRAVAALLLLVFSTASAAPAKEAPPVNVARGDPQREAILAALHKEVDADLAQPNKFLVETLKTQAGWSFAVVHPRTLAGGPIDLGKTGYAKAARDGLMDGDTIYALLRKTPKGWVVKAWAIGPTDVAWATWPEEFGAPNALLGLPNP